MSRAMSAPRRSTSSCTTPRSSGASSATSRATRPRALSQRLFRGGEAVPSGPETVLQKGDVLRVTGSRYRIKLLEKESGQVVHASLATDIVTLASVSPSARSSALITIPNRKREVRPRLCRRAPPRRNRAQHESAHVILASVARIPEPARRLIEDIGLNVFVAILGINAGAGVLRAIAQGALTPIVVGCLVVGFIPPIIAWFVGRKLLKMNSALLLGAVAGGRCNSAGMRAASEVLAEQRPCDQLSRDVRESRTSC